MNKTKREGAPRALVTGASAGIGEVFAQRLARDGYDLIVVARSRDRLEQLAEQLRAQHQVRVEPLAADLTDPAQLHVVESMIEGSDGLDLLVNNAGFGTLGRFAELDADREESEVRLNVLALMRLTRAALPGMLKRRRGAIVNVSSLAGFQPAPYNATYAATKAFVTSFTESLSEELRGSGVGLQVLCPGFTRTEFQERAEIDVSRIPNAMWMSAEAVVDASLQALKRGDLICIPGLQNKVMATLTSFVPRSLTRRLVAVMARSAVGAG